ncbi:hypothetical protein BGY98DRAFT_989250 [Russula aff. rugulosa BPL654]|nr:hypothetical protein BGY98DRAFT_989250 [Russula aff. rugulosa BPL654]
MLPALPAIDYVGVASFTVLVWDHIITFSDEVEYIWKGAKGWGRCHSFFRLVNRYLIPLSFIVNLWAYFRADWSIRSCAHFIRYEGSMTMIGISIVFLMMMLRIRALYSRIFSIQAGVFAIFLTFVGVNAYVLTHGIPVYHPAYPLVDCCFHVPFGRLTGIPGRSSGKTLASSTAWLPLVFDSIVMFLTMYRTARSVYSRTTSDLFRVLFREGLLYYCCICTITLVLTIMITSTAQSIRNVVSHLTVALMSRITLHLRRFANGPNNVIIYHDNTAHQPHLRLPHPHQTFLSTVSQPIMTFAPPSPTASPPPPPPPQQTLPYIYPPQQPQVRPLPPTLPNDARAAAASSLSSLENGSYLGMDTFSTVKGALEPAEEFRM